MSDGVVTVCVRVRPLVAREREKDRDQLPALRLDGNAIGILDARSAVPEWRHFAFDRCLGQNEGQEVLYRHVGEPILQTGLEGFNGTLFAYGQTGSGKSFSIMGSDSDPGIIPQLLQRLYAVVGGADARDEPAAEVRVTMSFLEIYNEEIKDLLDPEARPRQKKLFVHQHPKLGIYVPNLTEAAATSADEAMRLLAFGAKIRATAQTNMNSTSSRSHSVLTLRITQVFPDGKIRKSGMHLCDLAGSERAKKTGASGQRMREGSAINSSLSVLGQVISKLASGAERKGIHVPFRQSKLTHLLMDALSGNSVTTMLANVSPARSEAEESLSTLRFAESVKLVKTKPKVTELAPEEPALMVKTLASEIALLQNALVEEGTCLPGELSRKIEASQSLAKSLSVQAGGQWAEAVEQTKALEDAQRKLLEERCLPMYEVGQLAGVSAGTPYLLNISDDPSLSGCLLYFLRPAPEITTVGRAGPHSIAPNSVVLEGLGIPARLAEIHFHEGEQGKIFQIFKTSGEAERGRLLVNGRPLSTGESCHLVHGSRVIFGWAFCFRLVVPGAATGDVSEEACFENISREVLQYSMTSTMEGMGMIRAVSQWSAELDRHGVDVEEREKLMEMVGEVFVQVEEANALCGEVRSAVPETLPVQLDVGFCFSFTPGTRPPAVVVQVWRHGDGCEEQRMLAAWPAADLERRLTMLRDVHREVLKGSSDSRWAWRLSRDDWWAGEANSAGESLQDGDITLMPGAAAEAAQNEEQEASMSASIEVESP